MTGNADWKQSDAAIYGFVVRSLHSSVTFGQIQWLEGRGSESPYPSSSYKLDNHSNWQNPPVFSIDFYSTGPRALHFFFSHWTEINYQSPGSCFSCMVRCSTRSSPSSQAILNFGPTRMGQHCCSNVGRGKVGPPQPWPLPDWSSAISKYYCIINL